MITICILNYNDFQTTEKLVREIKDYKNIDHVVVVDNNSSDDSYSRLSLLISEKVTVIQTERNGGYGYGNNYGIRYAIRQYNSQQICICNPDISISEEALQKCSDFISNNNNCIMVAPLMVDSKGVPQANCAWPIQPGLNYLLYSLKICGRLFDNLYKDLLEELTPYKADCIAGSCLLIDVKKFEEIGFYDENIFLYCEETLIGLKARLHEYDSFILRDVSFKHLHSVSINKSISSIVKQKKIMWDSRLYVLKKYYHWGKIKMLFAEIISKISIMEEELAHFRRSRGQ